MDPAVDNTVAYSVMTRRDAKPRPSRSSKRESRSGSRSDKSKNRKRSKDHKNLTELKQSLSTNCCTCCMVLAAYIKEAGKLIASCLNENPAQTKLSDLFNDLVTATYNLGSDLICLLNHLYKFLFVIGDKKRK